MTELKNIRKHPEGVEVAMEILKNAPDELLKEYVERIVIADEYDKEHSLTNIWCDLIDKWFENK